MAHRGCGRHRITAAVGLTLWLTSSSSTPVGLSVTTVTVPVTTGTIQQTVGEFGHPRAGQPGQLELRRVGHRQAVWVKAGQTVTAGQILANVGTTALSEDVSAAQAQLTAAGDRLSSDEAANAATSQIDTDEASVTSAESSLSTAQTNLNDASLTSTSAGTVASVNLTNGQQVTGSGTGGGGGDTGAAADASGDTGTGSTGTTGQIVVIGTDSYIVNTTVDDTEIGEIADGDQVDLTDTGSASPSTGRSAPSASSAARAPTSRPSPW